MSFTLTYHQANKCCLVANGNVTAIIHLISKCNKAKISGHQLQHDPLTYADEVQRESKDTHLNE